MCVGGGWLAPGGSQCACQQGKSSRQEHADWVLLHCKRRILRRKEEERAEKERRKAEKEAARQAALEEERRRAEEEAARMVRGARWGGSAAGRGAELELRLRGRLVPGCLGRVAPPGCARHEQQKGGE